jgi:hypothetical protein
MKLSPLKHHPLLQPRFQQTRGQSWLLASFTGEATLDNVNICIKLENNVYMTKITCRTLVDAIALLMPCLASARLCWLIVFLILSLEGLNPANRPARVIESIDLPSQHAQAWGLRRQYLQLCALQEAICARPRLRRPRLQGGWLLGRPRRALPGSGVRRVPPGGCMIHSSILQ